MTEAFNGFVESRESRPFVAQISFHNCHIPFIGSQTARAACAANTTCRAPEPGALPYTGEELDYYRSQPHTRSTRHVSFGQVTMAILVKGNSHVSSRHFRPTQTLLPTQLPLTLCSCLTELDSAFGRVLDTLETHGFLQNTMIWFTSDNGPEVNCKPAGFCGGTQHRPTEAPGSAGILRGRKRDVWEGGHRVPGIVSWPGRVRGHWVSWETVSTVDFLPTVMEVLGVVRPAAQAGWKMDGTSLVSLLTGGANATLSPRGMGWYYGIGPDGAIPSVQRGYGFRFGKWKFIHGSRSCTEESCRYPQLYDLSIDLGETRNVNETYPHIFKEIQRQFATWHNSILYSRAGESMCHLLPTKRPVSLVSRNSY